MAAPHDWQNFALTSLLTPHALQNMAPSLKDARFFRRRNTAVNGYAPVAEQRLR
jgi:hypothetical protein